MKLAPYLVAAAGTALILGVAACDNGITDINDNPNSPREVSTELFFANGATRSLELMRAATVDIYFTSLWAQHLAEFQYPDDDQFVLRGTRINNWWNGFYSGPLMDLEQARRQAVAEGNPNQQAPAMIMKAWMFANMTNLWGDIPYTEALKGDEGIVTPAYTPQEEIYDSLFVELRTAADLLAQDEGETYGSQDPIYGGDPAKWRKFANSLRARLALNLYLVNPSKAQDELADAVADGGFTSNDDNAVLIWPGNGVADNPTYVNQLTRDDVRLSQTLFGALDSLSDPRIPIYAEPAPVTGEYGGMPNALDAGDAGAWGNISSPPGSAITSNDSPSYLMTYAEYEFILAEAAARNWIPGDPATYYMNGIRASLEQWGVAQADIADYLDNPELAYDPATGIEQIVTQKWIALYTQGLEAWTEYRRTGIPDLQPGPEAAFEIVPRRIPYPVDEASRNGANLSAAIERLTPAPCDDEPANSYLQRMWWDVIPLPVTCE